MNPVARFPLLLATALLLAGCAGHDARHSADAPLERAVRATAVLDEVMRAPDHEMPQDMLQNAFAVAVLPHVINGGVVVAGRRGRGLIAVKRDGQWSNPSFVRLAGGSVGVQAGVSSTDLILIFRSERGVNSIVDGKFLLGTDLAVAAGPVGRNAQASTDAQLKAEIYAYSHSRGLFAGFALQGVSLAIDDDANHAAYGAGVTAPEIFDGRGPMPPEAVGTFRERLARYTRP